jgi:SSS family solute:Na+ symporter
LVYFFIRYWSTDFLVVQRAFSAKDLRAARMTPLLASFFKMALPFIVILAGLIAIALSSDPNSGFKLLEDGGQVNYDSALPLLIKRYYPTGLVGLGVTALLAGFMAGQAGNISAFNTVWTYDIYKSVLNKKHRMHIYFGWAGINNCWRINFLGTAYWAKFFPSIMDYMQAIFSWVNAPLFATMLWVCSFGGLPKRCIWGLVVGMLSSFFLWMGGKIPVVQRNYYYNVSVQSDQRKLLACLVGMVDLFRINNCNQFVTKKKPKEELVGLVKGLTEEKHDQHLPFVKRPEFVGLLCCCFSVT